MEGILNIILDVKVLFIYDILYMTEDFLLFYIENFILIILYFFLDLGV